MEICEHIFRPNDRRNFILEEIIGQLLGCNNNNDKKRK